MNANAFRHFYDYHFSENRKIWERYLPQISDEQFRLPATYSRGSIRDQVLHLMSADDAWFSELRGLQLPEMEEQIEKLAAAQPDDRQAIRACWDKIEQVMRAYLADLRDDMLLTNPVPEGEDKDLVLWQILIHVVNHGTDHRAQILRQLNDLGVKTEYQDYIFYVYEHL